VKRPAIPLLAALALAACTSAAPPAREITPLAQRIMQLDPKTQWRAVSETPIRFNTHHPQGMVRRGDQAFVTSVEIIRPTRRYPQPIDGQDRDTGEGRGHLFIIDASGALQADIPLGEGDSYHPGGLDFDGRWLWVPVAEYRPDSRAIIYRVDPATLVATEAFRVPDHIGAVAVDREGRALVGVSWGGARLYRWPLQPDGSVAPADLAAPPVSRARAHFIAWQDCHGLDGRVMACTGLSTYSRPGTNTSLSLGGVELIDLTDFRPLWQTPIMLWSPSGRSMLQNPAWFESTENGLRAWFMPDDDTSVLYAYENVPPG
jgi:hypothetical protein